MSSPATPPSQPLTGVAASATSENESSLTTPNASTEELNSLKSKESGSPSTPTSSPSPPLSPSKKSTPSLPPLQSQSQQQQQPRGRSATPPPPPHQRIVSTGELSENYFSSASSGGLSPPDQPSPVNGNRKRLTSDEILQNVKPAHQFVQYNQDSDGDGSIVFSYAPGTTPPATYELPQSFARAYGGFASASHERGASVDSSGTSGSFIRIPPYQQQQQRQRERERERAEQQQLQQQQQQQQQQHDDQEAKILPYHQRRKLMLKKQQRVKRQKQQEMQNLPPQQPQDDDRTNPMNRNYRNQRPIPLDTIGSQPTRRSTPPRSRQPQQHQHNQQQQLPQSMSNTANGQQANSYYNNLPPRSRTNSADRNAEQYQPHQQRRANNHTPELLSERYDAPENTRNRKTAPDPPAQHQQQNYYNYQQQHQQQQPMDDFISHQDLSPDARHFQRKREPSSSQQQQQQQSRPSSSRQQHSQHQQQQQQQQQQQPSQQQTQSRRKKELTPEKQSQYDYYFSQQRKYNKHQQRQQQQQQQRRYQQYQNQNVSTPPNYAHVRNESMGSVSSLGTADNDTPAGPSTTVKKQEKSSFFADQLGNDIAGYLQEQQGATSPAFNTNDNDPIVPPPPPIEQPNDKNRSSSSSQQHHKQQRSPSRPQHRHQNSNSHRRNNSSNGGGGSGFLVGLIQNLSPKQSHSSVQEYHQRNQAFLKKAERERAKKQNLQNAQASAHQQHKRSDSSGSASTSKSPSLSRSPRPPNSRGANRPGLASIDNDDWNSPAKAPKKLMKSAKGGGRKTAPSLDLEDNDDYAVAAIRSAELVKENRRQHQPSRSRHRSRTSSGDMSSDISGGSFISSSSSSSSSGSDSDDEESTSGGGDRRIASRGSSESHYNHHHQDHPRSHHHHQNRDLYYDEADERTSLLPPSGISSQEGERGSGTIDYHPRTTEVPVGKDGRPGGRHSSRYLAEQWGQEPTERWDNREVAVVGRRSKVERSRRKKKKSDRHRKLSSNTEDSDYLSDGSYYSNGSSSSSDHDYRRWAKKRAKMFHKERAKLISQWKEEARAEAELARKQQEASRWHKRLGRWMEQEFTNITDSTMKFFSTAETFICNLPLTIGAVALATVTLGVVWFKFAEENLDSCEPVHFHSSQCTFPEFPGCFYCDTSETMYKVAVNFHFGCSAFAGVLSMAFVAKCLLAWRVVLDEMSSPTMASPAGLLCMTTVCVFAGRGWIGQLLVSVAAMLHLGMVCWFIYMALAYHIMPEPSWFPNTVGVGLSAVKTWLYYPMPGHFLMAISLSLNFFFFPISLIRVYLNKKISAPVCWIQMSAPAISLYALTIMAQPSFEEEHPDVTRFQKVHRMVYLPCMHGLFALAVVGFLSSVQSLYARWDTFKKKEFSPAHAAFCFPTLAHANAIQAYRAAVDAFSDIKPGTPLKIALYVYWVVILVGGTIVTVWISLKFFYMLPSWTLVDVADEEEPPAPNETTLKDIISTGETLRQPFVSPAVLQANETGALIYIPRGPDGRGRYVRTRRLPALGFEPTMNWSEMNAERDVLLDWVAKNPPRRRKKTLSVPGIDFSYGFGESIGTGNTGVYGLEAGHDRAWSIGGHPDVRDRSNMYDPSYY